MGGRGVGMVLLLLAVVSVAVVPATRPHQVSGHAVAEPVPGPPAVGDCAVEPVESMLFRSNDALGGDYRYPVSTLEPCDGSRFGEVVAVIADPVEPIVSGTESAMSITDPNMDTCYTAVAAFIGTLGDESPAPGTWYPYLMVQASASSPTPRQQSDGQHWLACLAFAGGYGAAVAPYRGTVRDALTTGNQRDLLGFCTAGVDDTFGYTSGGCSIPHRYESFASGTTGDDIIDLAVLRTSCAETLVRVTGLADVTAAGRLTVTVTASDNYGRPVEGPQLPPNTSMSCGLLAVGDGQLDGSLIARGDQPLPWVA